MAAPTSPCGRLGTQDKAAGAVHAPSTPSDGADGAPDGSDEDDDEAGDSGDEDDATPLSEKGGAATDGASVSEKAGPAAVAESASHPDDGPSAVAVAVPDAATAAAEALSYPTARFNAALAVQRNVLYLCGAGGRDEGGGGAHTERTIPMS